MRKREPGERQAIRHFDGEYSRHDLRGVPHMFFIATPSLAKILLAEEYKGEPS